MHQAHHRRRIEAGAAAIEVLWCPTCLLPTIIQIRDFAKRRYYRAYQEVIRFFLFQSATVPLLLAGLSLQGHLHGGLIWLAFGLTVSLIVALYNPWVLLVEICAVMFARIASYTELLGPPFRSTSV
jgi:hypothetical protein